MFHEDTRNIPNMVAYNLFSDPELIDLLESGDKSAFTEIYNRYWKLLFKTALNILQDYTTAQDITQNIFISLWERRNETNIQTIKPYLLQATRFAVCKAIRERQNDKAFYERLAKITVDIIADNPLIFKEQQALLNKLINGLPENCREVFRLSREENMTYKQIATLSGISEKTVEKRISMSLQHIRNGVSLGICIAIICIN
jgi:RNA polymerase sigma-70 factor (ECF subfamily)